MKAELHSICHSCRLRMPTHYNYCPRCGEEFWPESAQTADEEWPDPPRRHDQPSVNLEGLYFEMYDLLADIEQNGQRVVPRNMPRIVSAVWRFEDQHHVDEERRDSGAA